MNKIILQKLNKKRLLGLAILVGLLILVAVISLTYSKKDTTNTTIVWKQSNTGLTTLSVNTIAADTNNQSILYAGTDTGIFKSIDKGESWTAMNNGFGNPTPDIQKILLATTNIKAVFALSTAGDLFETLDGGNNWSLRGIRIKDFALKLHSSESPFEKIYILLDDYADLTREIGSPIIYSISTGIGFLNKPSEKTRTEINSFYEDLYKNQDEINKRNGGESKIISKFIVDTGSREDTVNATKIDFLKEKEEILALLPQNSDFTWLQTNRTVYFCLYNFKGCEGDIEKEKINAHGFNLRYGAVTSYSQSGISHIYINPGNFVGRSDKLLILPCLELGSGQWILNDSLSKLGVIPTHIFVYSKNNYIKSSECYDKSEIKNKVGRDYLEDVIFAVADIEIADFQGYYTKLLISKDNAQTWKVFEGNLPISEESMFVTKTDLGYNVYITTDDNGIFKTSISSQELYSS
ncbi:MAG: hypothetical protein WC843_06720 [Candidatus Gracilibacteria bacterium]|jgi:hypothetical protein